MIPQVCPSCHSHVSEQHDAGCSFGTSEYQFLGWPLIDSDTSFLERYNAIDWNKIFEPGKIAQSVCEQNVTAISTLKSRAAELRKEAAAISLMDARAKRNFAADVLERIVEELTNEG